MSNLSWQIGDVRITRVLEREDKIPLAQLFPQATAAAFDRHRNWLQPHFIDAHNCSVLSLHALVIETKTSTIVVDTCIGEHKTFYDGSFPPMVENFLDRFLAAGFEREKVDYVLCTHLHFDHVGWNTMRTATGWQPTFPNARYLFARSEWQHWAAEQAAGSQFAVGLDETVQPVIDAGLADFVACDHRVDTAVRLLPTPGHTPGHVSVLIESNGETALITGDMTHHPVQWAEPDWLMIADSDSARAANTRRDIRAQYRNKPVLVIGTHYPTPCAGHLHGDDALTIFKTTY